jgi:hypothetical protein
MLRITPAHQKNVILNYKPIPASMKKIFISILMIMACGFSGINAQQPFSENIDRGVVALTIDGTHSYIGWRLLKTDPANVAFNVYRMEVGSTEYIKVNKEAITSTTDFIDGSVKAGMAYRYRIKAETNGEETESPGEGSVFMLS